MNTPAFFTSQMDWAVLFLCAWLIPAFLIGRWSQSRGNSFLTGFLITLFASPLVGVLMVGFTPPRVADNK